jgi:hypothetical protein
VIVNQRPQNFVHHHRIKPGGGLVQNQDFRFLRQRQQ